MAKWASCSRTYRRNCTKLKTTHNSSQIPGIFCLASCQHTASLTYLDCHIILCLFPDDKRLILTQTNDFSIFINEEAMQQLSHLEVVPGDL